MSNPTGSHTPTPAAAPVLRSLMLSWGRRDDASDQQFTHRATTTEQLAQTLNDIHTRAQQRGLPQLINVWAEEAQPRQDNGPLAWEPTRYQGDDLEQFVGDLPEPFIEAIIGDPERAGLRWLAMDIQAQASDPDLPELHDIEFDNAGAIDPLPASVFRLTHGDVQAILTVFLSESRRSDAYSWTELTFADADD